MPKSRIDRMRERTEIVQVCQWLWGSCVCVCVWRIREYDTSINIVRRWVRVHGKRIPVDISIQYNLLNISTPTRFHWISPENECCENDETRGKKQPFRREYLLLRYFSSANWESNKNGNYIEMHSAHNKWHTLLTLFLARQIDTNPITVDVNMPPHRMPKKINTTRIYMKCKFIFIFAVAPNDAGDEADEASALKYRIIRTNDWIVVRSFPVDCGKKLRCETWYGFCNRISLRIGFQFDFPFAR